LGATTQPDDGRGKTLLEFRKGRVRRKKRSVGKKGLIPGGKREERRLTRARGNRGKKNRKNLGGEIGLGRGKNLWDLGGSKKT